MVEQWKPVVGFENLYDVSSYGRVLSLRTSKIMRQSLNGRGYYKLNLYNGKKITRTVHQLVAEAFLGPCPDGLEVLHGAAGQRKNHTSNLSYGTRTQNSMDRVRDGTDRSIPITCSDGRHFRTLRAASRSTGIDQSSINKVLRGHRKSAGSFQWAYA